MNQLARVGLIMFGLLLILPLWVSAQLDAPAIFKKARPAVVLIEAGLTGTGLIIHQSGCILTAAHVIGSESQDEISIRVGDGRTFADAQLLNFDNKNDMAVLRIESTDLPTLELAGSEPVRELDEVVTIGYPKPDVLPTDAPTASSGRVEAVRSNVSYSFGFGRKAILDRAYQISGTIRPGSSGGPVLNADGKVIGIVASTPQTSELSSTAFVSPIQNAAIPRDCRSTSASMGWFPPVAVVLGLVLIGSAAYWTRRRFQKPRPTQLLREVPLFSELSDIELGALYEHCALREFAAGDYMIQEGDLEGHELFLIVKGQVEIRQTDRLVAKRGVGRTIGEMALLSGRPRSADAIATRPTQALVLSRSDLRKLYGDHPDIALKMLRDLYLRTQEADSQPYGTAAAKMT